MSGAGTADRLTPLAYHRAIVDWLRRHEPEVWAWSASNTAQAEHADEMRTAMLRNTYRLEAEGHPEVHASCRAAMAALGVEAPVTLYQASDGSMNASLCFIPGEVHLVFHGPILERLSTEERLALMGHEIAHYRLWSAEGGAFYTASRILDHALGYPQAAPAHLETARLYGLHTELFADRGSALAAGNPEAGVSTLVKVMTGLASMDPAAYLRQASELDTDGVKSEGESHPEIFLRARALEKWWRDEPDLEAWLQKRVCGPLSIATLDLPRQGDLEQLTRSFFSHFLSDPKLRSQEVETQVRRFFPGWTPGEPADLAAALAPEALDDPTREYLVALMFDCAMADKDARDELLVAAGRAAAKFGGLELFRAALRRDLKLTKAAADRLVGQAAKAA